MNEEIILIGPEGAQRGALTESMTRVEFDAWALAWAVAHIDAGLVLEALIEKHGFDEVYAGFTPWLPHSPADLPDLEPEPITCPPIVGQRDPEWAGEPITRESRLTIHDAGCYLCAYTSKLMSLGYDVDPLEVSAALDERDGFDGPELMRPQVLIEKYPLLGEYHRYDWVTIPVNMDVLITALALFGPQLVQVDFQAAWGVQPHFVLAYEYVSAADGGQDDELWAMCPWDGAYIDVAADVECGWNGKRAGGGYFWDDWKNERAWREGRVSRVQRVVHGMRAFTKEQEK